MCWSEAVAHLDSAVQARILTSIGAGIRAAQLSAEVAIVDGTIADAMHHLAEAIECLTTAQGLLTDPPPESG